MRKSGRYLEILVPELSACIHEVNDKSGNEDLSFLQVLSRADYARSSSVNFDEYLLEACGIKGLSDGYVSQASVLAYADTGLINSVPIICSDPVFLKGDPSRLMLFDADSIGINKSEADSLVSLLNDFFRRDGLNIWCKDPRRWFVEGLDHTIYAGTSPTKLTGTPLEPDMASRKALGDLGRIMTEAQMVLHDCEVNKRRLCEGKPPVNSIWLWGAGEQPLVSKPKITAVFTNDHFSKSCAKFSSLAVGSVEDIDLSMIQSGARGLVAIPPKYNLWQTNQILQRVIKYAVSSLKSGELTKLLIVSDRDTFLLDRRMLRRFWKRKKSLMRRIVDRGEIIE
jgi:hypothetical protein